MKPVEAPHFCVSLSFLLRRIAYVCLCPFPVSIDRELVRESLIRFPGHPHCRVAVDAGHLRLFPHAVKKGEDLLAATQVPSDRRVDSMPGLRYSATREVGR